MPKIFLKNPFKIISLLTAFSAYLYLTHERCVYSSVVPPFCYFRLWKICTMKSATFTSIFLAVIACLVSNHRAYSANILAFITDHSQSHCIIQKTLLKALVNRGHNVSRFWITNRQTAMVLWIELRIMHFCIANSATNHHANTNSDSVEDAQQFLQFSRLRWCQCVHPKHPSTQRQTSTSYT